MCLISKNNRENYAATPQDNRENHAATPQDPQVTFFCLLQSETDTHLIMESTLEIVTVEKDTPKFSKHWLLGRFQYLRLNQTKTKVQDPCSGGLREVPANKVVVEIQGK